MSTLTKVFVLLVSVLALFLCGAVVTLIGNNTNWQQAYENQRDITEAAQVQATAVQMKYSELDAVKDRLIAEQRQVNASLVERLVELQADRDEQALARAQAESQIATLVALSESVQQSNQNLHEVEQSLQGALREAYRARTNAEAEVIALNRQLNDERALTEQLESVRRRSQEQIYLLEEENAELRQRLQAAAASGVEFRSEAGGGVTMAIDGGTSPRVPIRGEITDIGDNLVSISVGSSSGVREGSEFRVLRGGDYVASLVVELVEPQQSAGRLINSQDQVFVGDRVSTGFD
ncbi:MAG: hypothetical protein JW936_09860 [Sedimentisphaerales bacterium]|nr:hypothetical protein [Sedimentisphaerales bacterium]